MHRTHKVLLLLLVWVTLTIGLMPIAFAGTTDDPLIATLPAKGVITVVQLDRYAGRLGSHRVQVFLGSTDPTRPG